MVICCRGLYVIVRPLFAFLHFVLFFSTVATVFLPLGNPAAARLLRQDSGSVKVGLEQDRALPPLHFHARPATHGASSIILFRTKISAGLMALLQMGQNAAAAAARLLTSYSTVTCVTPPPPISYLQYIGFALGFLLRPLVLTCRRPSHAPPSRRLAADKRPASRRLPCCQGA